MRKKICFCLYVSILLLSQSNISQMEVFALEEEVNIEDYNMDGLGYGYNVVKNGILDASEIKDGAPILTKEFLDEEKRNASIINVNSSSTTATSTNTMKELVKQFEGKSEFTGESGIVSNLFAANMDNAFSSFSQLNYNETASHYFYNLNSEIIRYTCSLPEYSNKRETYIQNLHPDFLKAIDDFANSKIEAKEIFEKFGTHVILKGKYGGTANVYYSITSNKASVGGEFKAKIDESIKASLFDKLGTNSNDLSIDLKGCLNDYASQTSSMLKIDAKGGDPFATTSLNSLNTHYNSWALSVKDAPVIIGTSSDGLLPIWRLIPHNYRIEVAYSLKLKYDEYEQKFFESIFNKYDSIDFKTDGDISYRFELRDGEKTIENNNIFDKETYDTLSLYDNLKYGLGIFKEKGYTKIKIELNLDIKEKDDGYQVFYLYNGSSDDSNSKLAEITYELGEWNTEKNYTNVTINFGCFPFEKFNDRDILYIRYGATGAFWNTWLNKNVKIIFTFIK